MYEQTNLKIIYPKELIHDVTALLAQIRILCNRVYATNEQLEGIIEELYIVEKTVNDIGKIVLSVPIGDSQVGSEQKEDGPVKTGFLAKFGGILDGMLPEELSKDPLDMLGGLIGGAFMDKPNDTSTTPYVVRKPLPQFCHSKGIESATRLTLDPSSQSLVQPHHFGTKVDEMDAKYVFSLPTMFERNITWGTTMAPGTTLAGGYLGPMSRFITDTAATSITTSFVRILPTTFEYALIAGGLRYWRGSLKFRIRIVASPMMTGRIAFCPLPGCYKKPNDVLTVQQALSYSHFIFDLQDVKKEFEIEVPYCSVFPYLKVCNGQPFQAPTSQAGILEMSKWFTGSWRIIVLNQLVAPDVCPSVAYINVFFAGGKDFEAVGNFDHNATFVGSFPKNVVLGESQGGEEGEDGEVTQVEESGNTELSAVAVHQRPIQAEGNTREIENEPPLSTDRTAEDRMWTLSDTMEKLNFLKTGIWNTTQNSGDILETFQVPFDLLATTACGTSTHAVTWANFRYVRFRRIKVTLMINSNKFQVGTLIMAYGPLLIDDPSQSQFNGRFGDNAFGIINWAGLTTIPHVLIDAGASNTGELNIPYINGVEYLHTEQIGTGQLNPFFNRLGTLQIRVLNPLLAGASQPGTVSYSIMVEFFGLEAHIPKTIPSFTIEGGFQDDEYENNRRPKPMGISQIGDSAEQDSVDDVRTMKQHSAVQRPMFARHAKNNLSHFGESFRSFRDLIKRYAPFITLRNEIVNNYVDPSGTVMNSATNTVNWPVAPPIEHVAGTVAFNTRGPMGTVGLMYGAWRGSIRYAILHRVDKALSAQNQVMFNPWDNPFINNHLAGAGYDVGRFNLAGIKEFEQDIFACDPSQFKLDATAAAAYRCRARGTTNAMDFTDDGASWQVVEVPYWSQYKMMKVPYFSPDTSGQPYLAFLSDYISLGEMTAATIYRTGQGAAGFDDITVLIGAGDDFRYGVLYGALPIVNQRFGSIIPGQTFPALYDCWQSA